MHVSEYTNIVERALEEFDDEYVYLRLKKDPKSSPIDLSYDEWNKRFQEFLEKQSHIPLSDR